MFKKRTRRMDPSSHPKRCPPCSGLWRTCSQSCLYPEIASKAGIEGRVLISFVVDEDGDVINPTVQRGIGAGRDEEALRVISRGEIQPRRARRPSCESEDDPADCMRIENLCHR